MVVSGTTHTRMLATRNVMQMCLPEGGAARIRCLDHRATPSLPAPVARTPCERRRW